MKNKLAVLSLLMVALGAVEGKSKKHSSLPEAFENAQTVFVQTASGSDITDIHLDRDERNAILDVQDGIKDWGRYTLSPSRLDADLVLVLYRGRFLRTRPSNGVPGAPRSSTGHLPMQNPGDASQGSGTGAPEDLQREKDELKVYAIDSNGELKGPIWRDDMDDGLRSPSLFLLQRLQAEVEKAYPNPPAKKPTP